MAERVYPASKPAAASNGTATTTVANGNPAFPANKSQLYNAARPAYRPQPRHRRKRGCCCRCCLWITLTIILLIILAAITCGVLWVLYRPHRPSFSVSSLHISQFNLTSSSQLNSKFNFTLTARNPNKKIAFFYDPISVSIQSDGVDVGDGSFPAFDLGRKNTTTLRTIVSSSGQSVPTSSNLKSDLKKNSVPLKIQLDTKVKVKIGGLKTKKVRVRVVCDGIKAAAPTGNSTTTATTSGAKCKVDLRIKIWKWTI